MADLGEVFLAGFQTGYGNMERLRKTLEDRSNRKRAQEVGAKFSARIQALQAEAAVASEEYENLRTKEANGEPVSPQEMMRAMTAANDKTFEVFSQGIDMLSEAHLADPGNKYLERALAPIGQMFMQKMAMQQNYLMQLTGMAHQSAEAEKGREFTAGENDENRQLTRDQMKQSADQFWAGYGQRERQFAVEAGQRERGLGLQERQLEESIAARKADDVRGDEALQLQKDQWAALEPNRKMELLREGMSVLKDAAANGVPVDKVVEALNAKGGDWDVETIGEFIHNYAGFEEGVQKSLRDLDNAISRAEKRGDEEGAQLFREQKEFFLRHQDEITKSEIKKQSRAIDEGTILTAVSNWGAKTGSFGRNVVGGMGSLVISPGYFLRGVYEGEDRPEKEARAGAKAATRDE
jgi:hypothetical protein